MILLEIGLKSIATYILMLIFMKIIGKTGIAQYTPYDLTFILILAAVLGAPLVDPSMPYQYAFVVFLVGLIVQQLFSHLSLKNKIRPYIENRPTVLIVDGEIIKENMRVTQFDMDQLLSALRLKEIKNIQEVEIGTLEPNGELSIVKKDVNRNSSGRGSTYLSLKQEALSKINRG